MSRSFNSRGSHAAILAAAIGVGIVSSSSPAAATIDGVTVVPGSLTQGVVQSSLGAGTQYDTDAANMADFPLNTGGFGGNVFGISTVNPDFGTNSLGGNANTLLAFGTGGGVTLQFAQPIHNAVGQKDFGIFTAVAVTASTGAIFNGNMEANILLSSDGVTWHTLTGTVVSNSTTYTNLATASLLNAPTTAYNYGKSSTANTDTTGNGVKPAVLNAFPLANYTEPMPDDHLFNGTGTNATRKAFATSTSTSTTDPNSYGEVFGSSAGGNWFDISQSGLQSVEYIRLNGINVGDGGANPQFDGIRLDAVFANAAAAPEPTTLCVVSIGAAMLLRRRRLA